MSCGKAARLRLCLLAHAARATHAKKVVVVPSSAVSVTSAAAASSGVRRPDTSFMLADSHAPMTPPAKKMDTTMPCCQLDSGMWPP